MKKRYRCYIRNMVGKDWRFTGRIKYFKFSDHTDMSFEVEYVIKIPIRKMFLLRKTEAIVTEWINEERIIIIKYEVPEITTTKCEEVTNG